MKKEEIFYEIILNDFPDRTWGKYSTSGHARAAVKTNPIYRGWAKNSGYKILKTTRTYEDQIEIVHKGACASLKDSGEKCDCYDDIL